MAESTGKKGKQSIDSFADDLDSMLGVDEPSQQQVGLIDDDDAIDRLLMGDVFPDEDQHQTEAIDLMLDVDPTADRKPEAFADDDIDDIIAGIDLKRNRQSAPVEEVAAEMADLDAVADEVDLSALESVGVVDDFADDPSVRSEDGESPDTLIDEVKGDEFDSMTEIDEFSELPVSAVADNADFLLADFNISADDDAVLAPAQNLDVSPNLEVPASPAVAATIVAEPAAADEFADDDLDTEFVLAPEPAAITETTAIIDVVETETETEIGSPPPLASADAAQTPLPPAPPVMVDHSAELAALTAQINELKKSQKQTKHDFEYKADKQELTSCLEDIENLQTEQKKAKRNLEALVNKKPVGVYAANAVAGVAMLVAVGLWIDSFITKSQVEQLVEIIGQLKQQLESAPTADAADKELLRKQVDDLTIAQSVANAQIAELVKGVHNDGGSEKPAGDFGKQFNELSNQDMAMGAAIETLQNKVAALEKGKVTAAAPTKPVVKKPVVIAENWAVNLVAFKQDWYAKRKADEFASKGVPAKVSRTESKGEIWYRLSVDGFGSQYEAAAYAAKVKKTLNLDSVWVAKNKD